MSIARIDASCRCVQQKMKTARLTVSLQKALDVRMPAKIGDQLIDD
jgi:hypothetical protein